VFFAGGVYFWFEQELLAVTTASSSRARVHCVCDAKEVPFLIKTGD